MLLLSRIRTNPQLKTLARRLEKRLKRVLVAALQRMLPPPSPETIDSLEGVTRILIIRPNFRLGNALISTPVIDALRQRFPAARIDYLTTDKTLPLLAQQPVDYFHVLSRTAILRPWQCLSLLRQLRAARYDLAVQVSSGSTTGLMVTRLINARYSMGRRRGALRSYHVEVEGRASHAYEDIVLLTRPLGIACRPRPTLLLTLAERQQALSQLQQLAVPMQANGNGAPFIAVFVGGHQNKRWPLSFWLRLITDLETRSLAHVVFVGPEEARLAPTLAQHMATATFGSLCYPRPLREFAAMLDNAQLLITPDSGPMHLAAALDVPSIALLREKKSLRFAPQGPFDTPLWQPSHLDVLNAIQATLAQETQAEPVYFNALAS
ncbi:glycosyltransferase family 9 protein [Halomonas sp. TP35]|jgi:heptosyltransferase-3|tara:strand:- start:3447 stop:4583 length:1137 start_codon:yes stop_codon:yes gene_type:complete